MIARDLLFVQSAIRALLNEVFLHLFKSLMNAYDYLFKCSLQEI
jgi:hypothetical protein